ncbi:hypothetical protein LTR37_014958 [Vermiconidia calcicola]|uniref:Uncharacterized protein n=1 Tax=Vermiconidia calcicola TaxID=1690605 RepID=A0ACC3MS54_9PEZI|nr:hypothetical protein LTR37_014958 [Vermiconidia calcicola]
MCQSQPKTILPSYARPTIASQSRRQATTEAKQECASLKCNRSSENETFKHYRRTNFVLRRRARVPFAFLALPPEVRNRIYEYTGIGHMPRHADFQDLRIVDARQCVPTLLRINRQIRDEAGSYWFRGCFDIIVDRSRIYLFFDWLRYIGRRNRERLANNSDVAVRLSASSEETSKLPRNKQKTHICRLGAELSHLAEAHPPLRDWKFFNTSLLGLDYWRRWMHLEEGRHSGIRDLVFTAGFFMSLRILLRGVIKVLEGRGMHSGHFEGEGKWLNLVPMTVTRMVEVEGSHGRRWKLHLVTPWTDGLPDQSVFRIGSDGL